MRGCQLVAALALLTAPAYSFIVAPGGALSRKFHSGSRQAQLTRRHILDGLQNIGKLASGEVSGEDLTLGPENAALLARFERRAERINDLEKSIEALSDAELRAKTKAFQATLAEGSETLDDLLEEAFAVVREAAWRVLELRHYDVQLIGGMVLHEGRLAEMATGEGKTLAATLPTYLNALEGRGALVVTANEYLAQRDAETVGQVYRFLGLRVGLVTGALDEPARAEAYAADVTFVTNSELGFDYLRDNLALTPDALVLPAPRGGADGGGGPSFCLVDEADSILIDEARTPLIISKQVEAPSDKYELSAQLAQVLKGSGGAGGEDDAAAARAAEAGKGEADYVVDLKGQQVTLTGKGFARCEEILQKPLFDAKDPWAPFILNALKAKALFEKDVQYVVKEGGAGGGAEGAAAAKAEVCIVDTFSGRVMDGRRWSDGLHQSIEAKEGLAVSTESKVIATVTYQSLFRRFPKLCGMSGTAMSDSKELAKVYGLRVTPIPTALPIARRDYDDVVYKTAGAKTRAVVAEVLRAASTGRPVLVGTTSVNDSEELAETLRRKMGDQSHRLQVLNARPENVGKEGLVVSQAGRLGAVTVATNMAGRGTDILLGGNPGLLAALRVRDALAPSSLDEKALGAFEPMPADFYPAELSADAEAALAAAAAALVDASDPEDRFESSADLEEVVAIAGEQAPIADAGVLAVRAALQAAKREFAAALAPEKEEVRKLGGLYVVGTERHESRRIDRQLRGRAGRQGDPGASRFFLSLEDKMLRTFGADKLKGVMDAFRVSEDTPLEAKMVADAIDKVQTRVEEYYSDIRGQVFVFDDVLSTQRESFYKRRAQILQGDDAFLEQTLARFCDETVGDIVPNYLRPAGADAADAADAASGEGGGGGAGLLGGAVAVDGAGLATKIGQFFPGMPPLEPAALEEACAAGGKGASGGGAAAVTAAVQNAVAGGLDAKRAAMDGVRPRQFVRVGQYLALVQLDNNWADHLGRMKLLQESVVMRKYLGRDPLQEYITEGAGLFEDMLASARRSTVFSLFTYQAAKPPAA